MRNSAHYQIVLLGSIDKRASSFKRNLSARLRDLGLVSETVAYLTEKSYSTRDPRRPLIAIFFGYDGAADASHPTITSLLDNSSLVVTVVSALARVSLEIPERLRHINALEIAVGSKTTRLVSLVLENFRLLRRERKLFISYKRDDSQTVANQLYDALDSKGFDVFIDTRSVPPATDFQNELWHRLSDSDVVVLIDTPRFRESRWTTEELTRANATNIQILHVLWPAQSEDSSSSFSHFHELTEGDFQDWDVKNGAKELRVSAVDAICNLAEELRSRAIAARHRYLVDSFCDAARDHGFTPNVQPERWVSVDVSAGKTLAVVPTIGVPTSDRINYVFDSIANNNDTTIQTWILYDNRGMLTSWQRHLAWLDDYLPARSVSLVSSYEALTRIKK